MTQNGAVFKCHAQQIITGVPVPTIWWLHWGA